MAKLIPDVQIGTLGGSLLWVGAGIVIIVALFTSGFGPALITAAIVGVVLVVLYFAISRMLFRAKRGTR